MNPLEFIYYLGYSFKKSRSLKNWKRLPLKVISVGNITVGGTGKTPAVIAIAEEAMKRGYRPCILTRGYKGKAKGPCFISKGDGPLTGIDDSGDEASLMAERLKGIPIVKSKDRYEAGMFALKELTSQPSAISHRPLLFILDDGFQHLSLHRDIDILLIDSTNPFGNKKLLPSGILREPLTEMKRADIIVLTKTPELQRKTSHLSSEHKSGLLPDRSPLINEIRSYSPDAPLFISEHKPVYLRTFSGRKLPLDVISGKAVFAFCGIANPASFKDTLLRINAEVSDFMAFRDHYKYGRKDVCRITETAKKCNAGWIVTTEKDIIKFEDFDLIENLVSLCIEFEIEEAFYEEIFSTGP